MAKIEFPKEVTALHGGRSTFFIDTQPSRLKGVNSNQQSAVKTLLQAIGMAGRREEPLIASVVGAMGAGKSTVTVLTGLHLGESCQIFKHEIQAGFDGPDVNSHGGLKTRAEPYKSVIEAVERAIRPVVILEEVQFASPTDEELKETRRVMRREGIHALILTGLDFDFRRVPWQSARPILYNSDVSLVLTARCVKDGNPAFFTQRTIVENGVERPACYDDPVVLAGNVGEDGRPLTERYDPMCTSCHRVLPARGKR